MRSLRAGNPRAPCLDECQVATGVSGAVGRRCSRRSGSNDAGGTAQSAGVLIDSGCISGRSIRGCYFGRVFVGSSSKSPGVVDINPTVTALCAFVGALASVAVIALLARQRAATPSVIILAGVALSLLFTSGTSLIQYFADELQIAAIVFWAFGDLGRTRWPHLGVMTVVIVLALAFFVWKIWSYNALDAGGGRGASAGRKRDPAADLDADHRRCSNRHGGLRGGGYCVRWPYRASHCAALGG